MKELDVTFISGNAKKAEYLEKLLGLKIKYQKLELDEIQSLDLHKIVEHKVRQAYDLIKSPVIVEDVSLEFEDLHGLPGPFIKFFIDNIPFEKICNLVKENRNATTRCVFGYFDGTTMKLFEGAQNGKIPTVPKGDNGYGWDRLFIPEGYSQTRAEMNEEDNHKVYILSKPIEEVREFILSLTH